LEFIGMGKKVMNQMFSYQIDLDNLGTFMKVKLISILFSIKKRKK